MLVTATAADIATGTVIKSLLEIAAPTNKAIKLIRWWIEFDGVTASAVPVLVQITAHTTTMTGTALTLVKNKDTDITTIRSTAKHTSTSENAGTVTQLERHRIHPTSGFSYEYPQDREHEVSTFLRMRVTADATVNATCGIVVEE